mmetsp:Transcript_52578/g.136123  ORF Transcript_52578/g.136123 Transcript_52578/m.136123 type:complete len:269 (+) Transcript_52578:304-1110(+)
MFVEALAMLGHDPQLLVHEEQHMALGRDEEPDHVARPQLTRAPQPPGHLPARQVPRLATKLRSAAIVAQEPTERQKFAGVALEPPLDVHQMHDRVLRGFHRHTDAEAVAPARCVGLVDLNLEEPADDLFLHHLKGEREASVGVPRPTGAPVVRRELDRLGLPFRIERQQSLPGALVGLGLRMHCGTTPVPRHDLLKFGRCGGTGLLRTSACLRPQLDQSHVGERGDIWRRLPHCRPGEALHIGAQNGLAGARAVANRGFQRIANHLVV